MVTSNAIKWKEVFSLSCRCVNSESRPVLARLCHDVGAMLNAARFATSSPVTPSTSEWEEDGKDFLEDLFENKVTQRIHKFW